MRPGEWTLRGRRVVTPTGTRAADILIAGEVIADVGRYDDPAREGVVLDVGDRLVLPGLIELLGDGGEPRTRGSGWFETATSLAAAGGVTTIVDLPIDDRASSTSTGEFDDRLSGAAGMIRVDCGFLGGLLPGGAGQVASLIEAGVLGILIVPGRSSADDRHAGPGDLREAMATLARLGRPLVLCVSSRYGEFAGTEVVLAECIELARELDCRLHLLGLSTLEWLERVTEARARCRSITMEVAADCLVAGSEVVYGGLPPAAGQQPDRTPIPRDRLWDGLRMGTIDAIGSGPRKLDGSGASTLQECLPLVWAEAITRGFTADDLARWMSRRPAEILGLSGRKGAILGGADADFVVFDPDTPHEALPRSAGAGITRPLPSHGQLAGRVVATVLRGQIIAESGRSRGEPLGTAILRLDETEPQPGGLGWLNKLSQAEALDLLRNCCGSSQWAWRLLALRPFSSTADLLDAADRIWETLDRGDRLEAFAVHQRISEREAFRPRRSLTIFSANTPGRDSATSDFILTELHRFDREYEAKFDFRFIVSPSDIPATELLALLRRRLLNDPDEESRIASREFAELARKRLQALVKFPQSSTNRDTEDPGNWTGG